MKESTLTTGTQVSHYRITTCLGAGGMGEVYLAQDTRLGRQVALKFLTPEFSHDESRLRRFKQEACVASARRRSSEKRNGRRRLTRFRSSLTSQQAVFFTAPASTTVQ